jgi:hypothetical protein
MVAESKHVTTDIKPLYPQLGYDVITRQAGEKPELFWGRVGKACPRLSEKAGTEFFLPYLATVRTVVVERHYICKDHRNLYSHYYSKKFLLQDSYTSRLHLFERSFDSIGQLIVDKDPSAGYLGFSVVRGLASACVGRTVISPHPLKPPGDRFFCLTTEFRVHLAGRHLSVDGYPFMAQDAESTVCAHVALWGICRYLSERYPFYREMYPFDLVALSDPRDGRTSPYGGMTFQDYSRVFATFGCHPVMHKLREPRRGSGMKPMDSKAFKILYAYVESGIPVAVSIGKHAISVIGHTWNPAKPRKPRYWFGRFVDSSEFTDGLVVMDDNFFPYRVLAKRGRKQNNTYGRTFAARMKRSKPYCVEDINSMVCPLPEKAFLPADKARDVFLDLLYSWQENKNVERYFRSHDLVTRIFITTGTAIRESLSARMAKGQPLCEAEEGLFSIMLPHFVWVMEISSYDEYRNKLASGRLVIDATASSKEQSLILGHFRGWMLVTVEPSAPYLARIDMERSVGSFPILSHNFRQQFTSNQMSSK